MDTQQQEIEDRHAQGMVEKYSKIAHEAYEKAAVGAGWETNEKSRKRWEEVPEANRACTRAAVRAVLEGMGKITGEPKKPDPKETLRLIREYLGNGGFFNPEMMAHDRVRDLIMDCRECLEWLLAGRPFMSATVTSKVEPGAPWEPVKAPDSAPAEEESADDFVKRVGIDGKLWAAEIKKRFPFGMDSDVLESWCCNMIMAGYDEATRRAEARTERLRSLCNDVKGAVVSLVDERLKKYWTAKFDELL